MAEDYKAKLDQVNVRIGEFFAVMRELHSQEAAKAELAKAEGKAEGAAAAQATMKGIEMSMEYADELLTVE